MTVPKLKTELWLPLPPAELFPLIRFNSHSPAAGGVLVVRFRDRNL